MTVTGVAKGNDGNVVQNFTVQVQNSSGEIILNQSFTNGTYTIDAVPGYQYWFSGMPIYGGVLYDGNQLKNGGIVEIPINYPGVPKMAVNIYYVAALALIALTLYHETKKNKRRKS